MTATSEQLQLMLYDGAIRFAKQAREAILKNDLSTSCEKLLRAQRIMLQMDTGLQHDANPALCQQLASLYRFVYKRLIDANMTRDIAAIDESLQILEHQRETWRLLVERVSAVRNDPADAAETSLAGVSA